MLGNCFWLEKGLEMFRLPVPVGSLFSLSGTMVLLSVLMWNEGAPVPSSSPKGLQVFKNNGVVKAWTLSTIADGITIASPTTSEPRSLQFEGVDVSSSLLEMCHLELLSLNGEKTWS